METLYSLLGLFDDQEIQDFAQPPADQEGVDVKIVIDRVNDLLIELQEGIKS